MFENTFDVVFNLVKKWKPKKLYRKEEQYRNDLYEYLRKNLKEAETDVFGFGTKQYVIQKEAGRHLADIGINEKIGIELKTNFKKQSQKDRLVGQIKRFLRSYSHVIVVLCGDVDMGKVDELRSDLKDYKSSFGAFEEPKIVKIICKTKSETKKRKKEESIWSLF